MEFHSFRSSSLSPRSSSLTVSYTHLGSEIDCIVKEYHPRTGELIVSAKETEVNPFFGAEERHPVGSRRFARCV